MVPDEFTTERSYLRIQPSDDPLRAEQVPPTLGKFSEIAEDPARVAQVMRQWVNVDE